MPISENLTVQYHQQDTDYYCGAACAQMVLAELGGGLHPQDDLYNDNHDHSLTEGGWATAPDGLQWTLNNRKPSSSSAYFCLDALSSEDAISRMICWTIHNWKVAPVALVYGWQHWIVIRGYQASAAPSNSADNTYTITGFDVNNPWPPTPTPAPPPPHTVGDVCGSGGNRGVANEHISYATWQTDYMTGVPGGHWAGQFVAVCDPIPPNFQPGRVQHRRENSNRTSLVHTDEVAKLLEQGLRRHGLYEQENWAAALAGTSPGQSVLVQRLDRLDSFYYITPFEKKDGQHTVLGSIDARSGEYRQALALPSHGSIQFSELKKEAIMKMVHGRHFELEDQLGRLHVRPEAVCLYPTLVWKPCRESLSPFWPFHMLTIGSQHLYIRIDGTVFTALHTTDRGL